MRPHTGAYCSVQTVGRRAPSSFGESCAVTAPLTKYEARAGIVASGDAGAIRAASMAVPAMIMANTPNVLGEICLVAGAFPFRWNRNGGSVSAALFLLGRCSGRRGDGRGGDRRGGGGRRRGRRGQPLLIDEFLDPVLRPPRPVVLSRGLRERKGDVEPEHDGGENKKQNG